MRHTIADTQIANAIISAAFRTGTYCNASWPAGVWMFDTIAAQCVFSSQPALGAALAGSGKKNAHSRNYGPFKTKNKKHEAKIAKNPILERVATTSQFVVVDWFTHEMDHTHTTHINRSDFEQWLYETCRLDWCLHEISHSSKEQDNTMSPDNYWLYGEYGVQLQDLRTYMIEHRLARY